MDNHNENKNIKILVSVPGAAGGEGILNEILKLKMMKKCQ